VLIGAGLCAVVAALVLLWSPWSTEEPGEDLPEQPPVAEAEDETGEPEIEIPTISPRQMAETEAAKQQPTDAAEPAHELWVAPSGQPATFGALKLETGLVARRTLKAFPNDPDSHALMGNASLFSGRGAEAVSAWRRCLELDPARPGAYDGISMIAWKEGRFEEVVTTCRRALKYDANMSDVHFRLGRALIELDRAEEAVAVGQEAVNLWPGSDEAHLLLGQAYVQAEEYAEAQKCFTRAVEIDPNRTRAHYGLATVSARLGQREKAKRHKKRFDELINAERDNLAVWTRNESEASELTDQRARTAAIYAAAAGIYRKHGNTEQAERLMRRAATINPNPTGRR